MKKTLYLLAAFSFSCTHHVIETTIETIESDSHEKVNFAALFTDFNFYQLDTSDSCLFGIGIEKAEVFQDKIFLLNQLPSRRNILCFDTCGHFLFHIDRMGKGPGEYSYLGSFFIDRKSEQLVVDAENKEFLYFDLNGRHLRTSQSDDEYYCRQICPITDTTHLAFNDQSQPPYQYDLLLLDSKTFNIIQQSKASTPLSGLYHANVPVHIYNGKVYYYDVSDTVYDVSSLTDKTPKYFVNFGKNQKRNQLKLINLLNSPGKDVIHEARQMFAQNELVDVKSVVENSSYLVVNYDESDGENNFLSLTGSLFYDKKTHKTYNSKRINYDIFNSIKMNGKIEIQCCQDEKFYAFINLDEDFTEDEITKIQESNFLSDRDKRILQLKESTNNPILMTFK